MHGNLVPFGRSREARHDALLEYVLQRKYVWSLVPKAVRAVSVPVKGSAHDDAREHRQPQVSPSPAQRHVVQEGSIVLGASVGRIKEGCVNSRTKERRLPVRPKRVAIHCVSNDAQLVAETELWIVEARACAGGSILGKVNAVRTRLSLCSGCAYALLHPARERFEPGRRARGQQLPMPAQRSRAPCKNRGERMSGFLFHYYHYERGALLPPAMELHRVASLAALFSARSSGPLVARVAQPEEMHDEICAGTAQQDTAKAEDVCHVTIGELRSLAAVFDGHGGKRAAQLCESELVPTLLNAGLGSCLNGVGEHSGQESSAHERAPVPAPAGRAAAAGWGAPQRGAANGGAAAGWATGRHRRPSKEARIAEVHVELQSGGEGDANGGAAGNQALRVPSHAPTASVACPACNPMSMLCVCAGLPPDADVVDAFWDMDRRIGGGGIDDGTTATVLLVARQEANSSRQAESAAGTAAAAAGTAAAAATAAAATAAAAAAAATATPGSGVTLETAATAAAAAAATTPAPTFRCALAWVGDSSATQHGQTPSSRQRRAGQP